MKHFLLVYDRENGSLLLDEEYLAADRAQAFDKRWELERRYRGQPGIEVVVLSSESRENLIRTHGRYFKTLQELLEGAVPEAS